MTKEPRYEIRTGKYGQYFYDAENEKDMALVDVLLALNDQNVFCDPKGVVSKTMYERVLGDYEEVAVERDDLKDRLRKTGQILVEGIGSEGPEDADVTARRAIALLEVTRANLARTHEEGRALEARNDHLHNKLYRIVTLLPPGSGWDALDKIKEIAMEQLPPSDPVVAKVTRANFLAEIDDVLQSEPGLWVGGRLDTIKSLVKRLKSAGAIFDGYCIKCSAPRVSGEDKVCVNCQLDEAKLTINNQAAQIKDLLDQRNRLACEMELMRKDLASARSDRDAYKADFDAELEGNKELRKKYGAHDDETMFQFIARIVEESGREVSDLECANNALRSDLNDALTKVQWFTNKVADERLDGYRELGAKVAAAEERYDNEKQRRVYYQNIVYDVCNRLDAVLGGKTVCGTVDSPTTAVVERLNECLQSDWRLWAKQVAGFVGAAVTDDALRQSIEDLLGEQKIIPEGHRPAPFVSRKYHHDVVDGQRKTIDDLDSRLTEARKALAAAGIPEHAPYPEEDVDAHEKSLRTGGRALSVAERIAMLAQRLTVTDAQQSCPTTTDEVLDRSLNGLIDNCRKRQFLNVARHINNMQQRALDLLNVELKK